MFEEAQLYAPVTRSGEGDVTVHLGEDHPGAVDPEYRARRNALAALAMEWQPGTPPPVAPYTDVEHEVWRFVCGELHGLHERFACATYLEGKQRLQLPEDRIPQLTEVNELLGPLTGFRYVPAAGLVPLLEFYGALADGVFHSTQYVRHHSVPLYTPEPDVLHEVFGHGNCLAHDRFAALYRLAGEAVRRVKTGEALEFISKVFWFSLEFGVVREGGEVRSYGAGLLSSYGEIQQVAQADLRPLDIARMGVQTYDIAHYQPILFCAEGFDEVEDVVGAFFAEVDDDLVQRLMHDATAPA
ncbi:MAG: Phenylalanine-4-hydroxylase [uncultured Propionibacteriaceae bacterium]|uniref:Phenylalanine-4-hydroxylase n=1 Tax=uncultured Propionibacteriaceae bacterium TaxID=257457 RepID=A0A6J4N9N6_9ACTN|nr:MAG: Phenylalanine-4-hydroxylase [uncultured Propionibacteriaceae bacterium]